MAQIFKGIFGYPPVETGKPLATLYEYTMGELQKKDKRLLVALDDVDFLFHVNVAENILYKILRHMRYFLVLKQELLELLQIMHFHLKFLKN